MAGSAASEIHCWEMTIGDLNIYLASTRLGGLQIGLALEKKYDCITFFRKRFPGARLFKDYALNRPLIKWVEAALLNKPPGRIPDLDFSYTPFQWNVLKAITCIPYGETRSYRGVACMIGRPKSARAVGQALSKNPLPLIFP